MAKSSSAERNILVVKMLANTWDESNVAVVHGFDVLGVGVKCATI